MNRDLINELGSSNLYVFLENSPLSNIDLWGLWKFGPKGSDRRVALSEGGETVYSLAQLRGLQPEQFRRWLKPLEGGIPLPRHERRRIAKGCGYSVPNRAIVTQSFPPAGLWDEVTEFWAGMETDDIISHFRDLGYVVDNVDSNYQSILDTLSSEDVTAWGFVGHGFKNGSLFTADSLALFSSKVIEAQNHKFSEVILYACYSAQDINWRKTVSTFGKLYWHPDRFDTRWWDWEDLPVTNGTSD